MDSRVAALHLWALPLEACFDASSVLTSDAKPPVGVRAEIRGRWTLEAVSLDAMSAGVRPGMTLSEARARLPSLLVADRDLAAESRALSRVAELLFAFGPAVEVCPPNVLFVEIGRSEKILRERLGLSSSASTEAFEQAVVSALEATVKRAGHVASVVLGETPDTTRTLAQHLSCSQQPRIGGSRRVRARGRGRSPAAAKPRRVRIPKGPRTMIVPAGGEARALRSLPLEALVWTDTRQDPEGTRLERLRGALASLRVLGINEVSRLLTMPADQIASRFGEAGHILMERALARRARPLKLFRPPERLEERAELEGVAEGLESVLFVMQRLFSRLAERLDARALAVRSVELALLVEPGLDHTVDARAARKRSSKWVETIRLRFARPTRKAKTMLTLAQDELSGALPGAVCGVKVTAVAPHADRGAQLDLFTMHEQRVEAVGELVGRLQATLGEAAVFSPEVKNTHRPEASWRARAFDIDVALRRREETKPQRSLFSALALEEVARPKSADAYRLPEVELGLSVTGSTQGGGTSDEREGERTAPLATSAWPKPVKKTPADEPLAPVPPRPVVLFSRPEQATMLRSSEVDEGILVWRGRRHHLVGVSGREKLEAEWWTSSPVDRDYMIAESADGRRLWIYLTPDGDAHVHGIFD